MILREQSELWRCKRCRRVLERKECLTRYGLIECPSCLLTGWVGLLEKLDRVEPKEVTP
jgi:late competence protein required for DNA uptake (superfamily II DNA/RNA helicase)